MESSNRKTKDITKRKTKKDKAKRKKELQGTYSKKHIRMQLKKTKNN